MVHIIYEFAHNIMLFYNLISSDSVNKLYNMQEI